MQYDHYRLWPSVDIIMIIIGDGFGCNATSRWLGMRGERAKDCPPNASDFLGRGLPRQDKY